MNLDAKNRGKEVLRMEKKTVKNLSTFEGKKGLKNNKMHYKQNDTISVIREESSIIDDYNIQDEIYQYVHDDILKNDSKWNVKKRLNERLAKVYENLGQIKKAVRLLACGTFLEFAYYVSGKKKLLNASFCKCRLCPLCMWRKSMKIFGQVSQVLEYIKNRTDLMPQSYILFTGTIENVKGDDLGKTINLIHKGFEKMVRYKDIKAVINGYYRSTEVTYNGDTNTFHPHIHAIFAVDEDYFRGGQRYLTAEKWYTLWGKALKLDYCPSVSVKRIRKGSRGDIGKAIAEVAKYSVKSCDYLVHNEKTSMYIVKYLDEQLKGKRLIGFGGIFKEAIQELKLQDVETGDLTDNDMNDLNEDIAYQIVRCGWNIGCHRYVARVSKE